MGIKWQIDLLWNILQTTKVLELTACICDYNKTKSHSISSYSVGTCNLVYKNLRISHKNWERNLGKLTFIPCVGNRTFHSSIRESIHF